MTSTLLAVLLVLLCLNLLCLTALVTLAALLLHRLSGRTATEVARWLREPRPTPYYA